MVVYGRDAVIEKVRQWRLNGDKIGYTSGAFDILHAGHLDYLSKAKDYCDRLVVGVNTDASIRSYKSELRPIIGEGERVRLVAGLKPVDVAFLFAETNNNVNIEMIRPDFYIKAQDYTKAKLSSTPIVESYGGEVKLIPLVPGLSSSSIIEKIQGLSLIANSPEEKAQVKPAAFLDRDGTLIELVDYLDDPDRVKILPTVIEGLLKLREAGFRLIITTNQPGIGMGYYTKDQFYKVTLRMLKLFSSSGVLIDKIYYSPHTMAEVSNDRKPQPGMIHRAVEELNVDLSNSIVIGDSTADIEFARRGGCKYAGLVLTGKLGKDELYESKADIEAATFVEVVEQFLFLNS